MAKVVKATSRHNCREEIARSADVPADLYIGSIVECSCGKQFILRDDQRDGRYWADHRAGTPAT